MTLSFIGCHARCAVILLLPDHNWNVHMPKQITNASSNPFGEAKQSSLAVARGRIGGSWWWQGFRHWQLREVGSVAVGGGEAK